MRVVVGWCDWGGNIYGFKDGKMATDKQLLQKISQDLMYRHFGDCIVCGRPETGALCELHAADEITAVATERDWGYMLGDYEVIS